MLNIPATLAYCSQCRHAPRRTPPTPSLTPFFALTPLIDLALVIITSTTTRLQRRLRTGWSRANQPSSTPHYYLRIKIILASAASLDLLSRRRQFAKQLLMVSPMMLILLLVRRIIIVGGEEYAHNSSFNTFDFCLTFFPLARPAPSFSCRPPSTFSPLSSPHRLANKTLWPAREEMDGLM